MTGDQLLRRAQRGDREALDDLCQREWRAVYGVVYQAVQDRQEAQESHPGSIPAGVEVAG